ncbi:MAG: radical SAM protein [bacterium]|nr:radical SAM protein [bacterium]
MKHRRKIWGLVCSDEQGNFWDEPHLQALARSGKFMRLPEDDELAPLPDDCVLQYLPARHPLIARYKGSEALDCYVLAAQLPSGWTRTLLPAWECEKGAKALPIFGYTAVFCRNGELFCAALQSENNPRWKPSNYAPGPLRRRIKRLYEKLPHNRIVKQLENCAVNYGCYNAYNIFAGRWEGAVPVSPVCNAGCRGCISLQPEGRPPSPQIRLNFVPSVEEIVELGLMHIANPEAIFTFGQGCEGEPLMQADTIAKAIKEIRSHTGAGTLHMNSNGSLTEGARKVIEAGLDSMRVSMISAREETYNAYYRPRNYAFANVAETIRIAKDNGLWVSINLLMIPGLNDSQAELETLIEFVKAHKIDMIQMRNLNFDPDLLFQEIPIPDEPSLGVPEMMRVLRCEVPQVRLGSHNPHKETFR